MRPGSAHLAAKARRAPAARAPGLAAPRAPRAPRALGALVALTAVAALHHAACGGPRGPAGTAATPEGRCDALDRADVRVGCPCPAGLEPLGGGCVSQAGRAPACGPRVDPADVACAAVRCPRGAALDPTRGACVTPSELGALPDVTWLGLHEGERLECPDGGTLELAQGHVACRVRGACRFHTIWNGKECARPTACPAGSFRELTRDEAPRPAAGDAGDAGSRRPADLATATTREGTKCTSLLVGRAVDLGAWLRHVVEPELCALLPLGPVESYLVEASAVGNELSALSIAIDPARPTLGGAPTGPAPSTPGATQQLLRRAIEALAEGLRSLRLETSTTRATRTITCPARPAPAPRIEPKEPPDAGW
ncbi:MAG: hypothetical protein IPF92_13475 [Myxococcales bacterium]|nr:hypothetical protein [Myxococcales bacterium]